MEAYGQEDRAQEVIHDSGAIPPPPTSHIKGDQAGHQGHGLQRLQLNPHQHPLPDEGHA